MRSNVARQARRLFAAGEVGLVTSDDPKVLEQLIDTYLDVEARSWKAGTPAAVGFSDKRLAYFRQCVTGHTGVLPEMSILTLECVPIAAIVCGTFGTTSYALKMAYDDSFAGLAPGQLLLFLSVADAIRAQRDAYNLLNGFEHFKARLGADIIAKTTLKVYRVCRLPFLFLIARRIRHRVRGGGGHAARRGRNAGKRRAGTRRTGEPDTTRLTAEAQRLDTIARGPGRVQRHSHDDLARGLPFSID
jgi:hypothetical protein